MAKPVVFNWTAANTTDVCLLQTTTGAGSLVINGNLTSNTTGIPRSPYASNPAGYSATFIGCSRTVSVTSTANNSGINVTITGILNSASKTETIAGPNNTTVYTTGLFDTVTGVSVNGATAGGGISVGSGSTGQTHWHGYDFYVPYAATTVTVAITGTINYTFQATLDDVNTVANPDIIAGTVLPQAGNAQAFVLALNSATASGFGYFNYPVRYMNILVNSSAGGSLTATFIQQGIR